MRVLLFILTFAFLSAANAHPKNTTYVEKVKTYHCICKEKWVPPCRCKEVKSVVITKK